jgi:N4-gp56 family major capsid protein
MAFVSATTLANQTIVAYQRAALFALRSMVLFDQFARFKPGDLTNPGSPVRFTFWDDMATATTPLGETTDITPVALSDSQVNVTPYEYGNGINTTIKIRTDSYVAGFDANAASLVAWNMVETIDELARTGMDAGTQVAYIGQATEGAVLATNILTADLVRQYHAKLSSASVQPFDGDYVWVISPDVSYDLKSETGDGAWVAPAQYVNTEKIYNNEIGKFAGFRFIETPRVKLNADGGDTNVDTYTSYLIGKEALAKAESIPASMVLGPVTDLLLRWQPLGWYGYFGYGMLRQAAQWRIVGASSIGENA